MVILKQAIQLRPYYVCGGGDRITRPNNDTATLYYSPVTNLEFLSNIDSLIGCIVYSDIKIVLNSVELQSYYSIHNDGVFLVCTTAMSDSVGYTHIVSKISNAETATYIACDRFPIKGTAHYVWQPQLPFGLMKMYEASSGTFVDQNTTTYVIWREKSLYDQMIRSCIADMDL